MKRKILPFFSGIVFLAGFFLLDRGSFTGNAILTDSSSFNPLALLGLLLIIGSAILAAYTLRSR